MFLGVLFVLAACFCWGLIFLIPKLLVGFGPIEIALGRYLAFGAISALFLTRKRYLFQKEYLPIWTKAVWLGFLSTLLSYTCVVFSIRYASPAITALIFGMSPITIALSGNWYKKQFSFRSFIIPCSLMALGIILANLNAFSFSGESILMYSLGLLGGVIGLASWTCFTILNHHFMEKNKQISPNDWVLMMGGTTFLLSLLATGLFIGTSSDLSKYCQLSEELKQFIVGSLLLGAVSSWIGYFFWNCANLRLPISFAGQLTIFEMLFGLLFVYLADVKLPPLEEAAGITIMLFGLLIAFKNLKKISSETPVSDQ